MTAYDPSPNQPPPISKSSRTVAWGVGRAIVWLVYAFALVAIVIATIAVLSRTVRGQSKQWLRGMDLSQRKPRHCTLPWHLPFPCQRQLRSRRVAPLRNHHVRTLCAARPRTCRLHRASARRIRQPRSLRSATSCAAAARPPFVPGRGTARPCFVLAIAGPHTCLPIGRRSFHGSDARASEWRGMMVRERLSCGGGAIDATGSGFGSVVRAGGVVARLRWERFVSVVLVRRGQAYGALQLDRGRRSEPHEPRSLRASE